VILGIQKAEEVIEVFEKHGAGRILAITKVSQESPVIGAISEFQ
jgi:hypothetical protein